MHNLNSAVTGNFDAKYAYSIFASFALLIIIIVWNWLITPVSEGKHKNVTALLHGDLIVSLYGLEPARDGR